MIHRIPLTSQPGIRKGHLIWKEDGNAKRLDLSGGPFLLRISEKHLLLQSERDAGKTLDSRGFQTYAFLFDEGLYSLESDQPQMWFGKQALPQPDKSVTGFHAIGTGDIEDNLDNEDLRMVQHSAINLVYDGTEYRASIAVSKEAPNSILFRQDQELYHGLRRYPTKNAAPYQPGI